MIVQKFGGTSVADCEKILAAARKAIRAQQAGSQVVMVVSAMGKNTDMLVDLAGQITDRPSAREMDMLLSTGEQVSVALMAMAVHSLGAKAVSLTGAQIGIRTDSTYTKARILSISTDRMRELLNEGNIVIAAGFQGIDENLNITTLGRGGSDTTAVALAAVLNADACEIYTDVDGVYTTDPRILPEARLTTRISYDEMLELASLGAGVMHSRSIEFAKKYNVPIHVRSSFSDTPGTFIMAEPESRSMPVSGAALTKSEARISLLGVPDVPGTSLAIFSGLAQRHIGVNMIVQNVGDEGTADISFTVPRAELAVALEAVNEAAAELGARQVAYSTDVSKVSVVGLGMAEQTGVARTMFRALGEAGINMQMITTSEIKISALVDQQQASEALRTVHRAFELDKAVTPDVIQPLKAEPHDAAEVADRLHIVGMEDLSIDEVVLDERQARVTITGVADVPGVAGHVFERVAAEGVFVDMIIQSFPAEQGRALLSFTVPRDQLPQAIQVSQRLCDEMQLGGVSHAPEVAKLSVSGIGLRSHTEVAIRMFQTLHDIGVNVNMINTSEVRVNVVVAGKDGKRALAKLQETFAHYRK